jgi:ketosteroid isomerase-like protein
MASSLELVQSLYDAFAKVDVPTVLAAMDEQIEWHEAEHWAYWTGGPYIGPQAVLEGVFAPLGRDFDGFHVDIRRLVGCGDTVLAELRYRGTVKRTGKALDLQVAHVWDLRNGMVVRWQQYVDTWQAAQVMGVTPKA